MGFFSFPLTSRDQQEKRRMEAFMDALPLEYCGWNKDNIAVWSRDFPKLFGLSSLQDVRDIQQAILPSDAAALEGMIWRLQKEDEEFSLTVKTVDHDKILTLYGMKGNDLDNTESYDILWAEDTTHQHHQQDDLNDTLQQLRQDACQFQTILDSIPQSVWTTDNDNKLAWCNKAYTNVIGTARESILEKNEMIAIAPLDKTYLSTEDMIQKTAETDECQTTQARIIINGKRRFMDVTMTPHQKQKHVISVAHDITEQENLRAELKRYVSANAELMEQLSTAIAIFSAEQKLEFYNQAFSSLWGLEDQWLNTQPSLGDILEKLREMRRLPEQADFRRYKKSWLDLFTELIDQQQDMLHLPDGLAIRYMVAPHPMGGLMITFEDVTSRLELETSYNTLIAVQRETLDNLAQGVAVYGSDGRLKLSNPSYSKLWHLNPEDVDGEPHISQIIEKKKPLFKGRKYKWETIKTRLTAHAIDRTDTREKLHRSDNTTIECMSVPLPDGGVMVTYRDITDSIRVQQALEEKNQALEEAEQLKTDFLAKVSYQLRTPLNAISGFSEILNNEYFGQINDKQREYTQGIIDATNRLSHLIDDILDLSSIEAGYLRLDKNPVDVTEMVTDIYDLSRDWAGMDKLQIDLDIPKEKVGSLVIDERRIKQALINIIRNAIRSTPENGTISLTLANDPKNILVTVKHTGAMKKDGSDDIFKPLTNTSDNDDLKQESSGLGLSLAKNIIDLHNGTITIDTTDDNTVIQITLPK